MVALSGMNHIALAILASLGGGSDMSTDTGIVFVVDDDQRIREAVCDLLGARRIDAFAFDSVTSYSAFERPDRAACLVLDIELPDISGLEFQRRIDREDHPPIVFVTGHGDIRSSVSAMKYGAVDFLTKPFLEHELMQSVLAAWERDRNERCQRSRIANLLARLAMLTPREREVLPLIASGLKNKQAAAGLGISEVTLQIHRSRIMKKMECRSFAELVRIAGKLGIENLVGNGP